MNIHFNLINPFLFKETILSSLTIRQRTILIVAAAAFSFLAACYITYRYYLMATPLKEQGNDTFNVEEEERGDDSLPDQTKNTLDSDGIWTEDSLQQQMVQATQADRLATLNSWKKGLGYNEREQTLEAFKIAPETQLNAPRTHLKVVVFGEISPRDRQILEIVCDYLQAFHGLDTMLDLTPLTLDDAHVRHRPHPQYPIEPHLAKLQSLLPANSFFLGFTDQDLYPYAYADDINFIFGVGILEQACGLFSIHRMRTKNFEQTLKRLMRLATHEFSHMRGISHCTQYVCNMQGANSLQEADQAPLTFCSQDMAKICHLNHWNLKKGYENQLSFFENFFERYGKQIDFSQEIAHLKQKITKINHIH